MDETRRKKGDLPFRNKLNQIKVVWQSQINILGELISSCNILEDDKSNIFFKVVDVIKELKGPPIIKESILLTKEDMGTELSKLRKIWDNNFDSLTDFSKE